MKMKKGRRFLVMLLLVSLQTGMCAFDGYSAEASGLQTKAQNDSVSKSDVVPESESVSESSAVSESAVWQDAVSGTAVSPEPTAMPKAYILQNKGAGYHKGGQKGIGWRRIKGKKIYHLRGYTTDPVVLSMSHPSVFRIYGAGTKKEIRKRNIRVSSGGKVTCQKAAQQKERYVLIEAKSKLTGEKRYIYLRLRRKLSCCNGRKIKLYERYSQLLRFNYAKKNLIFSIEDKEKASVNRKGRIRGIRHGTTYVTVRIKGSRYNKVRIRIAVKVEPWIVSVKNKKYDYEDMKNDLYKLQRKYRGKTEVLNLGTTWDQRNIYCLRIGKAGASQRLVLDAAIHGREWKNVQILMRQTEDVLRLYRENKERFQNTCIYIIPMVNPDGVSIAQYGFSAIQNKKLRKTCQKIGHAKVWKSNARGVNLNGNFPAGFRAGKKNSKVTKPDYQFYSGKKAGSEKETQALMKFLRRIQPDTVLNVHSTGSIIYWNFNVDGVLYQKIYELAQKVNSFNQYPLMPKGSSTNAGGGLADWLVYNRKTAAITIETGTTACPLPHAQFSTIYKENRKMFRWFMLAY